MTDTPLDADGLAGAAPPGALDPLVPIDRILLCFMGTGELTSRQRTHRGLPEDVAGELLDKLYARWRSSPPRKLVGLGEELIRSDPDPGSASCPPCKLVRRVRAYVLKSFKNEVHDRWESELSGPEVVPLVGEPVVSRGGGGVGVIDRLLWKILEELSEVDRLLVEMRLLGYRYHEIHRVLGRGVLCAHPSDPVDSLRQKHKRILQRVRDELAFLPEFKDLNDD